MHAWLNHPFTHTGLPPPPPPPHAGEVAARAAVCTTLSGCAGGLACLLNAFRRNKVGLCLLLLLDCLLVILLVPQQGTAIVSSACMGCGGVVPAPRTHAACLAVGRNTGRG
jgi:hypothetical protein